MTSVDATPTIVLAGGASRRMGTDKLALPLDGVPMLQRTLDRLPGPVIVVTDPGRAATTPVSHTPGLRRVADTRPGEGPLAALEAGIAACLGAPIVLVVAGDMPWLEPAVLELLVATLAASPDAAVACLADEGGPRPVPLALRPALLVAPLRELLESGERRLRALLRHALVVRLGEWQPLDPQRATLRDIDTPADLLAAR